MKKQLSGPLLWQNIIALVVFIGAIAVGWFGYRALFPNTAVNQTYQHNDLQVNLRIDTLLVGTRTITVRLYDNAGRAIDAEAVRLRFSMVEMEMGDTDIEAERIGKGRYQLRGPVFTMVGNWTVEMTIERADQPSVRVSDTFFVTSP